MGYLLPVSDRFNPKFTGKERDSETSLDYFGARYMSSAQGRFTSPDDPLIGQHPADPRSWNLYAYVRNNPLRLIDPTGQFAVEGSGGCMENGKPMPMCSGAPKPADPPTISSLPESRGNPIRERGVGFVKGAVTTVLELARIAGAPDANVDQVEGVLHLEPSSKNEKFGGQVFGIILALLPGGAGGRVIRVLEEDAGAIHLQVRTAKGAYEVMANVSREGGTLILDRAHIAAEAGVGAFGAGMRTELREAAIQFGRERGATEVIVKPGVRLGGRGAVSPIRVKVE
jgi:RHS repeat-associated protein